MIALIGLWSHALAALLYGGLAAWQARHWKGDVRNRPLVAAFTATAVWAAAEAAVGPLALVTSLAEIARNLAFLTFLYGIVQAAEGDAPQGAIRYVYAAVAATVGLQTAIALMIPFLAGDAEAAAPLLMTRNSLGMTIAAGGLVLVHNFYARAARGSRWSIRFPAIALAALWAYDLHLYTVTHLTGHAFADLFALRGAFAVMLAPLFAMAAKRNTEWRIKLSRSATFRWVSLIAILGYFVAMLSASRMVGLAQGDGARIAQVALIFGMALLALLLLPSGRMRAWLHVMIAKHLFEHRYDYREDWLRFSRTLGRAGDDPLPVEERVVKALAEMAGALGGLLLCPEDGRLRVSARWHWPHDEVPAGPVPDEFARFLTETGFILDFARYDGPQWLAQGGAAWAGVPLIHNDRLVGLVLIDHPTPRRPMDWEDFDLFRTAGIQAASYLAEAQGQEALSQARRFDEFNRRFAFIMHDIKNLVSQLSLVARNAERHAGNPEFRADMVATLQASVKKMNDLLAKLAGASGGAAEAPEPLAIRPLLDMVAETKRRQHPIEVSGDPAIAALADRERLEQALLHLVQNGIEATEGDAPVRLSCARDRAEVRIEVADSGAGMTADFVRTRLFQPFASTKPSGFGIGAFEARTLVSAMGGRLDVDSREGVGTRFTIHLPASEPAHAPQRISA